MNAEEKEKYYRSEYFGSPTIDHINFRCQKLLSTWLRLKAMEENRNTQVRDKGLNP